MKLKNIQSIDLKGEAGLSNYSSMDKKVWDYYSSNPNNLEHISQEIIKK